MDKDKRKTTDASLQPRPTPRSEHLTLNRPHLSTACMRWLLVCGHVQGYTTWPINTLEGLHQKGTATPGRTQLYSHDTFLLPASYPSVMTVMPAHRKHLRPPLCLLQCVPMHPHPYHYQGSNDTLPSPSRGHLARCGWDPRSVMDDGGNGACWSCHLRLCVVC